MRHESGKWGLTTRGSAWDCMTSSWMLYSSEMSLNKQSITVWSARAPAIWTPSRGVQLLRVCNDGVMTRGPFRRAVQASDILRQDTGRTFESNAPLGCTEQIAAAHTNRLIGYLHGRLSANILSTVNTHFIGVLHIQSPSAFSATTQSPDAVFETSVPYADCIHCTSNTISCMICIHVTLCPSTPSVHLLRTAQHFPFPIVVIQPLIADCIPISSTHT